MLLGLISLCTTNARSFYYFGDEKVYLDKKDSSTRAKVASSESPNSDGPVFKTDRGLDVRIGTKIFAKCDSEEQLQQFSDYIHTNCGLTHLEALGFLPNWYVVDTTGSDITDAESIIKLCANAVESGLVAACEPEKTSFKENGYCLTYDPWSSSQWGLYNKAHPGVDINVARVWDYVDGGIDWQKRYYHYIGLVDTRANAPSELKNRFQIIGSAPNIPQYQGPGQHGTSVAVIMAAQRNNDFGICGVNPEAHILQYVIDDDSSDQYIAEGIVKCAKGHCAVINCSFEVAPSLVIEDAIGYALSFGRKEFGTLIVAAAGDNSANSVSYPASSNNVLSVGAIDETGRRLSTSNLGADIVAPGSNIPTLGIFGNISNMSGTSAACAHVSAVVSLLVQYRPTTRFDEILRIIKESANTSVLIGGNWQSKESMAWSPEFGYGLIDAYEALMLLPEELDSNYPPQR